LERYGQFETKMLKKGNCQLIIRERFEMLEQIDPDFDVWAYFLNPTLQKVLGL